MHNGREPDNNWGLNPGSPEKVSTCELRNIMSHLKEPLSTGSPCMNNTFRDALPVKLRKLFNQMVILKEDRSCEMKNPSSGEAINQPQEKIRKIEAPGHSYRYKTGKITLGSFR